jgi:hypothetical protein
MSIWSFCGRSCVLPLWKARTSRVEEEPVGDSLVVFSGSLRSPDEPDALSVKLSIRDSQITMHADDMELGSWPATAVDVRRFGGRAFEFSAEGDRLIFTPDDPAAFDDHPIVGGHDADTGGRKRRKSRKKSDEAEPKLAWDQDSPEEERYARGGTGQEPPKQRRRKPSRRDRKAAAEPVGAEPTGADVVAVAPPVAPLMIEPSSEDRQPETDGESSGGRRARKSPEPDDVGFREPKARSNRAWIRALDLARKYDTFGLDRVPIDESLRGQEHQHTWDHRVAATSGLGKHICTICGAIRR